MYLSTMQRILDVRENIQRAPELCVSRKSWFCMQDDRRRLIKDIKHGRARVLTRGIHSLMNEYDSYHHTSNKRQGLNNKASYNLGVYIQNKILEKYPFV